VPDFSGVAPRLPQTPGERRVVAIVLTGVLGLFAAEIATRPGPIRLSIIAMFLAWGPLLVIHELGHALAAWVVNWHVAEIGIGFGRQLWRFRIGETVVRIKILPVEGYVRPAPRTGTRARWKLAWIYFWGPGAEMGVLALMLALHEGDLFARTEAPLQLIMQGTAVAVGMSLFFNLLPIPFGTRTNDGMGILGSFLAPTAAFEARLTGPFILSARRLLMADEPAEAEAGLMHALASHPGDLRLRAWRAVCVAARGDTRSADNLWRDIGDPATHSPYVAAELHAAKANAYLVAGDSQLLMFAARSAESACALAPGDLQNQLLRGRIAFERGRYAEAFASLMDAYREASEPEEEAPCVAFLAMTCHHLLQSPATDDAENARPLVRPDYVRRFSEALKQLPTSVSLRSRVASTLAAR
jgi:Peptidase family M50